MGERIGKVVENRSNLGSITLFLGAKTRVFGRGRESMEHIRGRRFQVDLAASGELSESSLSNNVSYH
jgi:hypothetical protein